VVAGAVQLSRIGRIAESDLKCVGDHYPNVRVDSFVVMPNHVHAIIFIDGDHAYTPNPIRRAPVAQGFGSPAAGSLATIVRSYKAGVTRQCRELGLVNVVWQTSFHDHILRNDAAISAVREYMWNNPGNWANDRENLTRR
jgi:REP element-mobilizing transposase RayT